MRARIMGLVALTTLAARSASADEQAAAVGPVDQPAPVGTSPERASSGLEVGLRSGVAVPIGQAFTSGGAMGDSIKGYVPLRLDLGYRFARHFYVGAAAQLAAIVPNNCSANESCSGSDLRLATLVAFHLLPDRMIDPWIGVGIGYERLSLTRSVGTTSLRFGAHGVELADFELGADVRVSRALRLGPVVSSSIGRFTSISVNDVRTRDFDTSLHAWAMLGVRGTFDF